MSEIIHHSKILAGITILDFSHRLPGPLAGKVLADMGAKVIKIEDETHKDPFLTGFFQDFDKSFIDWYQELNQQKQILRFDFKTPEAKKEIAILLGQADGVLLSLSDKLKQNLGLDDDTLSNYNLAAINLGSSEFLKQGMHDLNAMALTGLLQLYIHDKNEKILTPPFLPISGILFGQQVATELCGLILQVKKQQKTIISTSYLFETANNVLTPFWSLKQRSEKKTKFLHNGAYPCYTLYQTADEHYLAVAAVEEHFWERFQTLLAIPLSKEERFNTDDASFNKVADVIQTLSMESIKKKIQGYDICVTPVEKLK